MYNTSTFFAHLLLVMLVRGSAVKTDVLARASSLSVFHSVIAKHGAIRIADTHKNLPRASTLNNYYGLIAKLASKPGRILQYSSRALTPGRAEDVFTATLFHSFRDESCHVNAILFRPGLNQPGMKSSI